MEDGGRRGEGKWGEVGGRWGGMGESSWGGVV